MTIPVGFSGTGEGGFISIGEDRCRTLILTIWQGWEKAVAFPEVGPTLKEVEINECLRRGMRCALADDSLGSRRLEIFILPGAESHSSDASLRPNGLTDIPICFTRIREMHHEHGPHAIIECKRVSETDADLARLYVCKGIDRFNDGKYASQHAVGFMVGYLLSGDADAVAEKINRYLTSKKRQKEHLRQPALIEVGWGRKSRHPRPSLGKPICLHHAFLGFRSTHS